MKDLNLSKKNADDWIEIPSEFDLKHALKYFNLGTQLIQRGITDIAIECFSESIQCDPYYTEAYLSRAEAYGKDSRAVADYTQALDTDSRCIRAYMGRGILSCSLGKYKQGLQDYETALEIDPNQAEIYIYQAIAYEELGEIRRATDAYLTAIVLNPKVMTALSEGSPNKYLKHGLLNISTTDYARHVKIDTEIEKPTHISPFQQQRLKQLQDKYDTPFFIEDDPGNVNENEIGPTTPLKFLP